MFKSPVQLEEWIALDGAIATVVGGEGDGGNKQGGGDSGDAAGSGNTDGDANSDPVNPDGVGESGDSDEGGFMLMSIPVPSSVFDEPGWEQYFGSTTYDFPSGAEGKLFAKLFINYGDLDMMAPGLVAQIGDPSFDSHWTVTLSGPPGANAKMTFYHDSLSQKLGIEFSFDNNAVALYISTYGTSWNACSFNYSNGSGSPYYFNFYANYSASSNDIPPTVIVVPQPSGGDDPIDPTDPNKDDPFAFEPIQFDSPWRESPVPEWHIEKYETDLLDRAPLIGMTPWDYLDPEDFGAIPTAAYLEGKAALGRLTTALAVLRDQAAQNPEALEDVDLDSIGGILRNGEAMRETLTGQLQLFQEMGKAFQAIDPALRDGVMNDVFATGAARVIAAGQDAETMASGIDAVTDLLRDSAPDGYEINEAYADAVALAAANIGAKAIRSDQEGIEYNASQSKQGMVLGNF